MMKKAVQRTKMVIKASFMIMMLNISCNERKISDQAYIKITDDSLLSISKAWKSDFSGCLKLRHPVKIKQLIVQLNLIGSDSTAVKKYLGQPNKVSFVKGEKYYTYFMECVGEKKISYSNFYCYFRGDSLYTYQHAMY